MSIAFLLVVAAVLSFVVVIGFSVSRGLRLSRRGPVSGRIQPIDVEAFRNLIDPGQTEYLRERLSPAEFRVVQRARLRAMAAYIRGAADNASVLIRVGQAAVLAADPRTLAAAQELVNQALLVRRNALVALLRIHIALTVPGAAMSPSQVFAGYQRMSHSAMLLGRLQNPASGSRMAAR